MDPTDDSFLLVRSEPICIKPQVETFIQTFICGYDVKTINDFVISEFKTTIFYTLDGRDRLQLHKYEVFSYSHKDALKNHVNMLTYIDSSLEKHKKEVK